MLEKSFLLILINFFLFQNLYSQGSYQASGVCQRTKNVYCPEAQVSSDLRN